MKFNDLNIQNWKELDINVDSLWLIDERYKSGKHSNIYHGNFIPQIPYQLIKRYTKENDIVLDTFLGCGTTMYVAEELNRYCIGFDINREMIDYVKQQMNDLYSSKYFIKECDSSNKLLFNEKIQEALTIIGKNSIQFAILHPPYLDIVKFTDKKEDLSSISDVNIFLEKFKNVVENSFRFLENNRYLAIVIGDIYKNGEVVPLSFYIMDMIKQNFSVKLKGIIIKNIEGNRGKIGKQDIWKYRALNSDYFIFKHEYIFVFKKES